MKSVAAKASTSGARASSPAVFGVSPNTFSIKDRLHYFLNRSYTLLRQKPKDYISGCGVCGYVSFGDYFASC